jgi:tRNA threonylcarbamoyladenosine biosynthesis protein TsaB
MVLLAADTSGKHGSIALARVPEGTVDARSIEVLEVVPLAGGTFSAQLVPQISRLLASHALTKHHIGAFAVVSGPGSFTGLRVGLAAVKALAEILEKPIAAVSLLEAVARGGKSGGRILAVLDAGRGEVYVGEYEVGAHARMLSERLLTRSELVNDARERTVVTPDARLASLACGSGLNTELIEQPRSDAIARLGWEKIRSGRTIAPEDLEANYIRRSDAEIFAKSS